MTKKIRIYLGDLTYNSIVLANDVFPLNIGYIASYILKNYGEFVDITLFKYIDDLEKALVESPPDILGLSNYCWNERIGYEMFRIAKKSNPDILTVFGGPNFPVDIPSQEEYMKEHPEIMFYVPIEGEIGFSNLVEKMLKINPNKKIIDEMLKEPIEGCISRKNDLTLQYSNPVTRIKQLDDIPSPYITGLLDKFFNTELNPMIQTNRGCPFSCSFCVDGNDNVKQINNFSIQRVEEELHHIGEKIPKNKNLLYISDLNFGMYPKDLEVCDAIAQIQQKYGYPKRIVVSTGKNRKERIINAIKRLNGALRFLIAVQSTNNEVLQNIKRDNISVDQMMALAPAIKSENLRTSAEVIVGLPGDSYETNMETIQDLLRAQTDDIGVYTLILLKGSELNTPHERKKWGFKTKFRILSKDFTELSSGKKILEIEEVVISSNSLSFEDYVKIRVMAFIIMVTNIGIVYDSVLKYIRQKNIDTFELFDKMIKSYENEKSINKIIDSYKKVTVSELWDSPEEIENYYQNDENYAKLLDESEGYNVIQHHHSMVTSKFMGEWTNFVINQTNEVLKQNGFADQQTQMELQDIKNYCQGLSYNVLGEDRLKTNPKFEFTHDIEKWLKDETEKTIEEFKFSESKKIVFNLEQIQYTTIQNSLDAFPKTNVGLSQAFKTFPIHLLWRTPHIIAS